MANVSGFLKRHPGAANLGLVVMGNNAEPAAHRAQMRSNAKLQRLSGRLTKLAQDAVAMVKDPMQKEDFGELDTPEKSAAHHSIKASQQVNGLDAPENPDGEEILAHLEAAMEACQHSPMGHQLMPQLQHLYQQIVGGEEDKSVGDSDQWTRPF